jgi:hypothetical protein
MSSTAAERTMSADTSINPRVVLRRLVRFGPSFDTYFLVGRQGGFGAFLVNSPTVTTHSPILRTKIRKAGAWVGVEGTNLKMKRVDLPDDSPEAFAVILSILHGRAMPTRVGVRLLLGVLQTADKYQLMHLLKPWRDYWRTLVNSRWDPRLLPCAYYMGDIDGFLLEIRFLTMNSQICKEHNLEVFKDHVDFEHHPHLEDLKAIMPDELGAVLDDACHFRSVLINRVAGLAAEARRHLVSPANSIAIDFNGDPWPDPCPDCHHAELSSLTTILEADLHLWDCLYYEHTLIDYGHAEFRQLWSKTFEQYVAALGRFPMGEEACRCSALARLSRKINILVVMLECVDFSQDLGHLRQAFEEKRRVLEHMPQAVPPVEDTVAEALGEIDSAYSEPDLLGSSGEDGVELGIPSWPEAA